MNHLGTRTLVTPRLTLRRFEEGDIPAAFRNWCSDAEVTKYLRWPAHPTQDVTRMVLTDWINSYQQPDFYQWAIVPADVGEAVGTISVVEQDDRTQKMHIGYCIGRPWQNMGYMTEALRRVMAFLFEDVGANRIESQHDPNNPASGRVMTKCGIQPEAVLRQADWSNQGIVDACMHAILRQEWEAQHIGG